MATSSGRLSVLVYNVLPCDVSSRCTVFSVMLFVACGYSHWLHYITVVGYFFWQVLHCHGWYAFVGSTPLRSVQENRYCAKLGTSNLAPRNFMTVQLC